MSAPASTDPRPMADALLARAGLPAQDRAPSAVSGGGNNRAFRVMAGGRPYFLKHYYRDEADPRDRFRAETSFLQYAQQHGIAATPRLLAADAATGSALMEFIPGERVTPDTLRAEDVDAAVAFFTALNRARHSEEARALPTASEACFALADHVALVKRRLARLDQMSDADAEDLDARELARGRLHAFWRALEARLAGASDEALPPATRALSPSDFGFHNALREGDGRLRFVDFEYAGWDDPAKTIADFFLQPAVPVPWNRYAGVTAAMARALDQGEPLLRRARLLHPLFGVKWCCILLNEFVPRDAARRGYARPEEDRRMRKRQQLDRARALLDRLESETLAP